MPWDSVDPWRDEDFWPPRGRRKEERMKFKVGDKVMHWGSPGTILSEQEGGYRVEFQEMTDIFCYESELTLAGEPEKQYDADADDPVFDSVRDEAL